MAKKDNTHPILQEIKNTAKEHQAFEKERGKDLIYGHALDIASKKLVNVDWNTACAMAKNGTLTLNESIQEEQMRQIPFPQGALSKTFGLISIHDEQITKEPIYSVHFPDLREGVLFPHQIEAMNRKMKLGTLEVADATREILKALVEKSEIIDTAGMNNEIFKGIADHRIENGNVIVFKMDEAHSHFDSSSTETNSKPFVYLDEFGKYSTESTKGKVFYSKRNQLMGEWEALLTDPHYEEIPYEIESFEEMGLWAKNRGGTLFFPTTSVADLRNLSEEEMENIESNVNVKFFTPDEAEHSFVMGRTRDAGKAFSIEGLIQQMREENPSLSEEEIAIKVYDRCHALKAINGDENFKRSFFTNLRKYGGAPIQKNKSFVRSSQDKHAKAKFSARSH